MKDLDVVDLYDGNSKEATDEFVKDIDSTLRVKTDYNKTVEDVEWLALMEEVVRYIDNIFRNPNRFIINEEEVVQVEKAKKITVESIKHLSRNTNFIQEYDKDTEEVRPSKILNINKEESYDTYENRFVYSLVQNMKAFINRKKKAVEEREDLEDKNDKKIEYRGTSKLQGENVDISIMLNTRLDKKKSSKQEMLERIARLEDKVADITFLEVYKIIEKKRASLVRSPIRKTNLILKNTNFQYAIKLWNYMETNLDDKTENIAEKKDYEDKAELKTLVDETFLLNYLVASTLDKDKADDENEKENQEKIIAQATDSMLQKIAELNSDMSEDEFKKMIAKKFAIVKYKSIASITEIQKIFKEHIDGYLKKIS